MVTIIKRKIIQLIKKKINVSSDDFKNYIYVDKYLPKSKITN